MVKHEFHGELYSVLFSKDPGKLARLLCNVLRTKAAFGLGPGPTIFKALSNPTERNSTATVIADRFIALAESLGILPYENPEQGRWGENVYSNIAEVCESIEAILGITLSFGRVMGNYGIFADGRIINLRTPDNVYVTQRIESLLGGLRGKSVLEIGAGYGGITFYCHQLGVNTYTIVDLPIINVLQAFFLIKTLGSNEVRLFGESEEGQPVNILPYWIMHSFKDEMFDLCVNQDSLAEIPIKQTLEYLTIIPRCTKRFFVSINQEGQGPAGQPDLNQLWVSELIRDEPAYKRLSRHPYWIRRGYTEEVYGICR